MSFQSVRMDVLFERVDPDLLGPLNVNGQRKRKKTKLNLHPCAGN